MTTTPPLQPIRSTYRLQLLRDDQLADLKAGTLEVLADVGFRCPSAKALEIYADHGGSVDFDSRHVKLPPDVVLEAMSHAPRYYTMAARDPDFDLDLSDGGLYCATDGCGIETIDFEDRRRRASCKEDVARMARVSDALSSIGFYWPIVSAQDYQETAPLHELDASFQNTVKHVQTETVMDETTAEYAVEMAAVIAGSREALSRRPILSSLICTIAPLAQDKGGMESALVFAEAGLPVGFMSMANAGSTSPASLAGTLVTADAEIVSGIVLLQMAYPGTPVYHSLMPGIMHPRSGGYLGSSWEGGKLYALGVELAHMWGVPALAGAFGTDARVPGWQSAGDAASSLLLCALAGAETGAGLGLLEGCTLLYPEAIVLDTDVYHRVRMDVAGLDTSPGAAALDVIRKVGPAGHFLAQRHTREHLRKRQFSDISIQMKPEGGYRDPLQAAREKVSGLLASHHPQPLSPEQGKELQRILESAGRDLKKSEGS